jgi:hypothetical protein
MTNFGPPLRLTKQVPFDKKHKITLAVRFLKPEHTVRYYTGTGTARYPRNVANPIIGMAIQYLKGQCHEIFDPRFFSSIDHP